MSYIFKLAKGKILAAAPVESGKRKWEAIGQVCRAEGPSASSNRTRKGWVFNLEADGLGTSYVLKGRGDAKEQGFARAAAILSGGTLAALGCHATGDQQMEGEAPVLFVEKIGEAPEPVQVQAPAPEANERSVNLPTGDLKDRLIEEAVALSEAAYPGCIMSRQVYAEAYLRGYAAKA